eukprot:753489-Hanusia_phi.AAC.2
MRARPGLFQLSRTTAWCPSCSPSSLLPPASTTPRSPVACPSPWHAPSAIVGIAVTDPLDIVTN